MLKAEVKNLLGEKVDEIELSEKVFGVELNADLVHQVYVAQYANRRLSIAHTKTRGERSGSGRKPWRQKGTGRARVGSVRTPIWRKGGIVFGPRKERNFKQKVNKKMKRQALKMVLSGKLRDKELIVVDSLEFKNRKTKEAQMAVDKLKLKGSLLWAFTKEEQRNRQATRNLKNSSEKFLENLNVFDLLNRQFLIVSRKGIAYLENKYRETTNKAVKAKGEDDKVSNKK